ncbi:MAG: FG-GAP repeat protein [Phycisphaerae bacterium]|nr:FG-GAP repeat protein [Phycisphaerae bacterium]
MAGYRKSLGIGTITAIGLLLSLPMVVGQGCPTATPGRVVPIGGTWSTGGWTTGDDTTGGGSSTSPRLVFTNPLSDVSIEIGDSMLVQWTEQDLAATAAITLLLDPDNIYGNGNELVVMPLALASDQGNVGSFLLNTGLFNLQAATYRIVAKVTDGTNPDMLVTATGRILLYGHGLLPGNMAPTISMPEPAINLGAAQGDTVAIQYCGNDPDADGKTPSTKPDIVLMLDYDNDPTNDIDGVVDYFLTNGLGDRQTVFTRMCAAGSYPAPLEDIFTEVPTALTLDKVIILSCGKDNGCGLIIQVPLTDAQGNPVLDNQGNPVMVNQLTGPSSFTLSIDVGIIPLRDDGSPYYVRGLEWDHVNLPVNAYAPGTISITGMGAGTIDLGKVGRTVTGTRFLGFNAGDQAGSGGTDVGDINNDGVDDFVIVSRYGRGYEIGNVGMAHLIMGLANAQKFGSEVPLNSITTTYPGAMFYMPATSGTTGITSACRMGDVTGDGRPDFMLGVPHVEVFPEDHDDDPCDCCGENNMPSCNFDYLPNPETNDPSCGEVLGDAMTGYDYREFGDCTNDLDVTRSTPIDGGYAFLIASDNNDTAAYDLASSSFPSVLALDRCGSDRIDGAGWFGARFRGAWYTDEEVVLNTSQTVTPSSIIPDNQFGETVRTMPPMAISGGGLSAAASRFGTTVLISAPNAWGGRGNVVVTPNNDFINMTDITQIPNNSQSIPVYDKVGDCPACGRTYWFPTYTAIIGKAAGDHLGYGAAAGDYNLDGSQDILCGAPGASRNGIQRAGIVYVIFGRPDWPTVDLQTLNPPRMEIWGTRQDDGFGSMQAIVGDMNQDGLPDIGLSAQYADGPGGTDSGFIGIVFGGRRLTGENIFSVDQIATAQLPGVRFYGTQPGGHAGSVISNVGDFNGDNMDDLLICASDEYRTVDGIRRHGVAYLIFGGPHLRNQSFNLDQVGTASLPGIIFVSPYAADTAEEAPIDFVSAAGDINSDGFDDIMLGVSKADYINPLEPSQRRIDSGEMYLMYGSNTGSNSIQ